MPEVRLSDLRAKLDARTGQPGFKRNCAAIAAEIARLDKIQADQDAATFSADSAVEHGDLTAQPDAP